ncbi:MAG: SagB/ThcOx family dehydrogenase [Gammaproteobacteria bacterium]|nr:SagB/ThcOx family dehydrogenase [Gammaproteobacteria bacterium]
MTPLRRVCIVSLLPLVGGIDAMGQQSDEPVQLPPPILDGELSVESALQRRRSVREFARAPLSLEDVSQILWAAQGVTERQGLRTAPSAGALYPLEVYLVAGDVEQLEPGIYRYRENAHELVLMLEGDYRKRLASAALTQSWVHRAPAVVVIAGVYQRSARKYGQRAHRYVHIEVGHAAQNVYLQAVARGLGTVLVGAFDDTRVQRVLELPADHMPLGLMPVGKTR